MGASPYGPTYPSAAYVLALIGGILIALYGLVEAVESVVFRSAIESLLPGASDIVLAFGVLALVLGVLIVAFGLRLKSDPASARTSGVLIIVFALVSFVGGGGLFLGLILALVGGIMAATWHPTRWTDSAYAHPGYGLIGQPAGAGWATPTPPPPQAGTASRVCSACGSSNASAARFCAKCGAPLS